VKEHACSKNDSRESKSDWERKSDDERTRARTIHVQQERSYLLFYLGEIDLGLRVQRESLRVRILYVRMKDFININFFLSKIKIDFLPLR
jgi:hypothetical protein